MDYYLLLKCCKRQCTSYFHLPGPNHVQLKFNSKMQHVKRVLDFTLCLPWGPMDPKMKFDLTLLVADSKHDFHVT